MKKIVCVVGTRPEAIKMAPVILELRRQADRFATTVLATAQHREMLDQVMSVFRIVPDIDLDVMTAGQSLNAVAARILAGLDETLQRVQPDVVIAQGDTTTVMATALASFHRRIPFAHVEAGLRTGNRFAPYPEEINRRVAALVTDYHFAPTQSAAGNLLREGTDPAAVFVTGNTVIDALQHTVAHTAPSPTPFPSGQRYVLMTCHRREIFGEPIRNVFMAVRDFAVAYPQVGIWYPVHPNPNVLGPAREILGGVANVVLSPPLDYVAFVHAMNGAYLMLSDSGGVQEEAPALGKPVIVLRDSTERPEGVAAGSCRLVGPHRGPIMDALRELLEDPGAYARMAGARNPYGDGRAAVRIAAILHGEQPDMWAG